MREIDDLIDALRGTRREQRITQRDLASWLDVAEITIVEWESRRDTPLAGNLFSWAQALGYTVEIQGLPSSGPRRDSVVRRADQMTRVLRTLKQARDKSWLSQEKLAAQLGVSTWTIRMWESRQRTPRLVHLVAWCDVLGVRLVLNRGSAASKAPTD